MVVKRMKTRVSLFSMKSKHPGADGKASCLRAAPMDQRHSLPQLDPGLLHDCGNVCRGCCPEEYTYLCEGNLFCSSETIKSSTR